MFIFHPTAKNSTLMNKCPPMSYPLDGTNTAHFALRFLIWHMNQCEQQTQPNQP